MFNIQWLRFEEWIYLGDKGQGGHFINRFLDVEEIVYPEGIYSLTQVPDDVPFIARVTIKSLKGEAFPKMASSTMFPKNWNIKRIQEEIAYVYENTVAKGTNKRPRQASDIFDKYDGISSSGFKIRIEVNDFGDIMNAYPIL
ncbi:hypothetical protein HNP38_002249 [Chryseobacterium defluvii]|uniref:Bacterial EndoU nuclease domain-containing protein n=1 Tax=Chryseobacterium defluvii TaxID=160396 RepID=A0A840KHG2_9FLAO|nr:EndoU domain-containing protein [Chryseobacterium defluvii]MBB4806953.1 hypothetical protein [Chryseobacterium defluvii]